MRVNVVYRSHGGENRKDRPEWYSKLTALASFCASLDEARGGDAVLGEVVFLNDGPLPEDRLRLMRRHGTLVPVRGGTNRRSYLAGLKLAAERGWPEEDLVLFAEDDYLWRPSAVRELAAGAARAPGAYLAPYGSSETGPSPSRWLPHVSTTSTFAVRVRELRQDRRLLVLCCLSGGDFDHTSCLTLRGEQKFSPADLVRHHPGPEGSSALRALVRAVYLVVLRAAVVVRAHRRPSRRRPLLAAVPPLATHMELQWLGPGDWEALARSVRPAGTDPDPAAAPVAG